MTDALKGVFARQVARASALRGRQDPVYQVLSDHYTRMLQKLYPVWALIGPGLADPAHIEIHSRTVMLDSDRLLGDRQSISTGALEPWRILVSIGAALHEVFHAVHTKRWIVEADAHQADDPDPVMRQLVEDRRLLEEPRMEAHGIRDYPAATARGRFVRKAVRAAVGDVIAPQFMQAIALTAMSGQPVTRDLCGTSMTYLHARTYCGTVDPAVLAPLQAIWTQVLGTADVAALDDLYARLVWVDDGDLAGLDRLAREYRAIIGPPPAPPPHSSDNADRGTGAYGGGDVIGGDVEAGASDEPGDGTASSSGEPGGEGGSPTAGSLREAMEQAIAAGRQGELQQFNEDINLQDLVATASGQSLDSEPLGEGTGTGMPTGRMPDRGVNRPPCADEVQQAVRYANRLANARAAGFKQIDKRTPGGRFNARGYVRARAQRQQGAPVTSQAWNIRREIRAPLEEPHVGLIIDTSGSMSIHEYALGPIAWILTTGLHRFGGKVAISLFGNGCELLTDGSKALPQVPGIRTGGGTAFAGDAVELVCEHLDMENPRRPRFVYVLSDGAWSDSQSGIERIRQLQDLGVPTLHLSIGVAPLAVEATRISVLTDPADALGIVAHDTVSALRAQSRPRKGK